MPTGTRRTGWVAQIAGLQRGRVARRQLLAAGIPSSTIARLLTEGHLIPEHPGVYAVGHAGHVSGGAEAAALLAVGEDASLSHSSAAIRWDVPALIIAPAHIELTTPRKVKAPPGVIVHRTTGLLAEDTTIRDGLPVTSLARTILDQAPALSTRRLELALDQSQVLRPTTIRALRHLLERTSHHPGRSRLVRLLDEASGSTVTRSELEERLLSLVRRSGLPQPQTNQPLVGFEVDFLWRAEHLVVEVDGYRFHSGRRAFEHDRRKDVVLSSAGYLVLRFTARQITEEPLFVVAAIARALGAATA